MRVKSTVLAGLVAGALVLFLADPSAAVADTAAGAWLADAKSGCKVWDGVPEPGESVSWDGPCKDGVTDGSGTLLWLKDGVSTGSYVGERVAGKAEGHGVYTWSSGDRYDGNWKDDVPDGKGTYTWKNGSGYQGEWRSGKKQGRAFYIWPSGDHFEGLYQDDKPVSGVYVKADGSRYAAVISGDAIGPGDRRYTTDESLAVRRVGTRVCRPGSSLLGLIDTKMVGFVEAVGDSRIQIRIADPGSLIGQNYDGVPINQNSIIWDDPDHWGPC